MKEVASLRYGVIFKKAFSVPEIFKAFVHDFIGIDMDIDRVETEKSFSPPMGKVDTRFDLFAEDKKNRVIVDIQHIRYPDHYHRFLYYHCAAMMEMIADSGNYEPAAKVSTLVVLTSGDRHKKDIGITSFDPADLKGNPYGEIPHKIICICPKYLNSETPVPYREWMLAIEDSLDGTVDESAYRHPVIHRVFDLIEKDLITPKEYAVMKDEYSFRQVMDEEYGKGLEKGIEKGRRETAANFLKTGILTEEQVAQASGLSLEEIRKIRTSC
jgi:predicted transposase/invertase (TIGR01784 family)